MIRRKEDRYFARGVAIILAIILFLTSTVREVESIADYFCSSSLLGQRRVHANEE
jgi:hypothetical protein